MLSVTTSITILKPTDSVFAAVVLPIPYFVQEASGPMEEGKTVTWKFPEFDLRVPVTVQKVVPNELICFEWGSQLGGLNLCEFKLAKPHAHNPNADVEGPATTITVTESGWAASEKGREASYGNLAGWTHMICALKAYLEYGINLRKGAYLHYKF